MDDVPETFEMPQTFEKAAAKAFAVDVARVPDGIEVQVRGELDVMTAPLLWARLAELIPEAVTRVTLDLAGLAFIDSMGLGTLVRAHKRLAERGLQLVLRSVPAQARKVLALTGLDHVLTIAEDRPSTA